MGVYNVTDLDAAGILKGQYCTANLVSVGRSITDIAVNKLKPISSLRSIPELKSGGTELSA